MSLIRVAAFALALACAPAQQQFVPVSIAELCGMSDVIVDGTVAQVLMPVLSSVGKLQTPVEISVAQVLKGPPALKTLQLIEPGGKLGAKEEVYFGQLIPKAGERYILFLRRLDGQAGYVALGGLHGHYLIVNGRIVVHPAMPRILRTGFANAPVEKLLSEIREELSAK